MKDYRVENPEFVIRTLEASWQGVRVKRFNIDVDNRQPGGYGEEYAGRMLVFATFSGPKAALVDAGLVLPREFPPEGKTARLDRYGTELTMGVRTARLKLASFEAHDAEDVAQRIIDRMAQAIFEAVWRVRSRLVIDNTR